MSQQEMTFQLKIGWRLCPSVYEYIPPSVGPLVCRSVSNDRVKICENVHLRCCGCDCVKCVWGRPPVQNNNVTSDECLY